MQITVSNGDKMVYFQDLPDNSTLSTLIELLMSQNQGSRFTTKINNNGHELSFKADSLDLDTLIRKVNGIVVRTVTRKQPTMT